MSCLNVEEASWSINCLWLSSTTVFSRSTFSVYKIQFEQHFQRTMKKLIAMSCAYVKLRCFLKTRETTICTSYLINRWKWENNYSKQLLQKSYSTVRKSPRWGLQESEPFIHMQVIWIAWKLIQFLTSVVLPENLRESFEFDGFLYTKERLNGPRCSYNWSFSSLKKVALFFFTVG